MNSALTAIIADARNFFEQILKSVANEQADQQIHTVEERLYKQMMQLGKSLLEVFVAKQGTESVGQTHLTYAFSCSHCRLRLIFLNLS